MHLLENSNNLMNNTADVEYVIVCSIHHSESGMLIYISGYKERRLNNLHMLSTILELPKSIRLHRILHLPTACPVMQNVFIVRRN